MGALLVVTLGCQSTPGARPALQGLEGQWDITQVSGGSMQFGLRLTVREDGELGGVVQRILSGNVELDVTGYAPLDGELAEDQVVLVTTDTEGRMLRFELTMESDSLRVDAIEWSGENLVTDDRRWSARRGS